MCVQRWPVSLHGFASPWPSTLDRDLPDDTALPPRVLRALSPASAYADEPREETRPHTTGGGTRTSVHGPGEAAASRPDRGLLARLVRNHRDAAAGCVVHRTGLQ
jgi:hypothetical protein